jgi:hypothetical protein
MSDSVRPKSEREIALEKRIAELNAQLTEVNQDLFLAETTISGLTVDDAHRALVDQFKAVAMIINGASYDDLAEAQRTVMVQAVAQLKQNYDELWRSYETEKELQTTDVTVRPTIQDVERLLLCMGVPYAIGRIVTLVLQTAEPADRKANYLAAKEYLTQLLRQTS